MLETLLNSSTTKIVNLNLDENKFAQLLHALNSDQISLSERLLYILPGTLEYNCLQNSKLINILYKYINNTEKLNSLSYYILLETLYYLTIDSNTNEINQFFSYCQKINQKFINYISLSPIKKISNFEDKIEPLLKNILTLIKNHSSHIETIHCLISFINLYFSSKGYCRKIFNQETNIFLFETFLICYDKIKNHINKEIEKNLLIKTLKNNAYYLKYFPTITKNKTFVSLMAKYLPEWYPYVNIDCLDFFQEKLVDFINEIKQNHISLDLNYAYQEYEFLLYLADKLQSLQIRPSRYDNITKLIPYIPEEKALTLYQILSPYTSQAILLNHKVFEKKEHKEKLATLLKKYLTSSVDTRKLDEPKITISREIIDKLSDKQLFELIKRSFREKVEYYDNDNPTKKFIPIRFEYTKEALEEIDKKIFVWITNKETKNKKDLIQICTSFKKAFSNNLTS